MLFFYKKYTGWSKKLEPHNLESSNFLRRCEYIEKETPSKNILEFHKPFSSRSHHKLFFGHPVYILMKGGVPL